MFYRRTFLAVVVFVLTQYSFVSSSFDDEANSSNIEDAAAESLMEKDLVSDDDTNQHHDIPDALCGPFKSYPNILNITDKERENEFHPVVKLPLRNIPINDNTNRSCLASTIDIEQAKKQTSLQRSIKRLFSKPPFSRLLILSSTIMGSKKGDRASSSLLLGEDWNIGRYDENRQSMYTSELFTDDTTNSIDGFSGKRTVHLGIDIGGPVGTPIYSFVDGIVLHEGYNSDHGDYGYVVVIKHFLPNGDGNNNNNNRTVYALYGHLSKDGSHLRKVGTYIAKGKVIGRIGDSHENGGWKEPHVHFQLSISPPTTHDMPGACSVKDRHKALMIYPDPRYILGPVH